MSCVRREEGLWGWRHVCGTEIVSSFTAIQQKPFLQNKSSACANICTTQYFAQYRKYLYHTAAHWSMTSGHLTFQHWGENFLADITMSGHTTHVVGKFLHSYAVHAPPRIFNLAYLWCHIATITLCQRAENFPFNLKLISYQPRPTAVSEEFCEPLCILLSTLGTNYLWDRFFDQQKWLAEEKKKNYGLFCTFKQLLYNILWLTPEVTIWLRIFLRYMYSFYNFST